MARKSSGVGLGFYVEEFGPYWGTVAVGRKFVLGDTICSEGLPRGVRQFDNAGPGGDVYVVTGVGSEGGRIVVHLQ